MVPQDYGVDGVSLDESIDEVVNLNKRKRKQSKREDSKRRRVDTKRGNILERCNENNCARFGKNCGKFDDELRRRINISFYDLGDIRLQRSFIVSHVDEVPKKTKKKFGLCAEQRAHKDLLSAIPK